MTEKPDKPLPRRPYLRVEPDRKAKERSAYFRKAFAHLRPENKKTKG